MYILIDGAYFRLFTLILVFRVEVDDSFGRDDLLEMQLNAVQAMANPPTMGEAKPQEDKELERNVLERMQL